MVYGERGEENEREEEPRNGEKEAKGHSIIYDPCQEFTVKFTLEKAPCGCQYKL